MIITSPASSIPDNAIANNAFFPSVDLGALRDANRIDNTITEARLRSQVIERYRDFDSTDHKQQKELRRDAYWAIFDIFGKPGTDMELI